MVQIDPISATVYQNIAGLRRLLAGGSLDAGSLREVAARSLEACEELLQALDASQRAIAGMLARRREGAQP